MKIWAHRGCSYKYPENSLLAFAEALDYGITGVETDIQLTKDGRMVCIHDETLERTLGVGEYVKDLTLDELKELSSLIPTIEEVLDCLEEAMRERGILLNIELKTGKIRYEGIEEKIAALIHERGLEESILFSSFNPDSVKRIKELCPTVRAGALGRAASLCLKRRAKSGADDIHPELTSLDVPELPELAERGGFAVRVWNESEKLYPDWGTYCVYDLAELEAKGVTDFFTNVPEDYCDRIDRIEHN